MRPLVVVPVAGAKVQSSKKSNGGSFSEDLLNRYYEKGFPGAGEDVKARSSSSSGIEAGNKKKRPRIIGPAFLRYAVPDKEEEEQEQEADERRDTWARYKPRVFFASPQFKLLTF